MNTEEKTGSFTVFFSLLCVPMILLWTSLFQWARFMVERNDALRMTQEAGQSILSCYAEELTRRYGLYGTEGSQIESRWKKFVEKNQRVSRAEIQQRLWTGIFAYEVEEIRISGFKTLQDLDIFRTQVERFMEYRILQEGIQNLMEYMGIVEDTVQGKGLEGCYAQIQMKLAEYNQQYGELIEILYRTRTQEIYVTMTRESPYRLEDFIQSVEFAKDESSMAEQMAEEWAERCERLEDCNRKGEEAIDQLIETMERMQQDFTAWDQAVSALTSEERSQDHVQDMMQELHATRESLWEIQEARELKRALRKNQETLERMKTQMKTGAETEQAALERAARIFSQYEDGMVLEYEIQEEEKQWDLGAVWDWIMEWQVDLKEYGADVDLAEDVDGEITEEAASQQALEQLEEETQRKVDTLLEKIRWIEYMVGMFRNLSDQQAGAGQNLRGDFFGESVFRNEAEFILEGKYNEYENLKSIQYRILAIRFAMNMAHLMADGEKQAAIRRMAASTGGIIAPGIGNAVVYGAILFLWTAAESYVDFGMLVEGKEVPLWKDQESWQTDLEKILERQWEKSERKEAKGVGYEMYLRLLGILSDTETSLERMQTLIHLNMQKSGMPDFQLSDMVSEFCAETVIQGSVQSYGSQGYFRYE